MEIKRQLPIEIFFDIENIMSDPAEIKSFPTGLPVRFHVLRNRNQMFPQKFIDKVASLDVDIIWYGFNPAGPDSLDIIIGALVGITAHAYEGEKVRIYILSKDNSYDAMCEVLSTKDRIVKRIERLSDINESGGCVHETTYHKCRPLINVMDARIIVSDTIGITKQEMILGVNDKSELVVMHSWSRKDEKITIYGFTVPPCPPDSNAYWRNIWQKDYLSETRQIGHINRLLSHSSGQISMDVDGMLACISGFQYRSIKQAMGNIEIDWATSFQKVFHKVDQKLDPQKFMVCLEPAFANHLLDE